MRIFDCSESDLPRDMILLLYCDNTKKRSLFILKKKVVG